LTALVDHCLSNVGVVWYEEVFSGRKFDQGSIFRLLRLNNWLESRGGSDDDGRGLLNQLPCVT
jgi:hypothetical protein